MDELKNIQIDTEIIPEGCLDFVEEAGYTCQFVEETYEEIMESIDGIDDEDENEDEDAVNESWDDVKAKAGDIANKVVEFLQKVWGQIKKMFTELIDWITEQAQKVKDAHLDKVITRASKDLKPTVKLGKYHEGDVGDTKFYEGMEKVISISKDTMSKAIKEESVDEMLKHTLGVVYNKLGGSGDSATLSMLKEQYKKHLLGKEIEVKGKDFNTGLAMKILGGSQKADVKKAYNAARKNINDMIKTVKGWKSTGEKTAAGDKVYTYDKDSDKRKKYKDYINLLRRYAQVLSQMCAVQCNAIRQQQREMYSIVMAAGRSTNQKKSSKNEAAIFAW